MKTKLVLIGAFALLCAPGAVEASSLNMNATTCYDPLTTLSPLGQGIVDPNPGDYVSIWAPYGSYVYTQDAYNSPHQTQDFGSFGIRADEEAAVGTYSFALFNYYEQGDPLTDFCGGDLYDAEGNPIGTSTIELCETVDTRYIETVEVELTGYCPE